MRSPHTNGLTNPMHDDEMRALRRLQRESAPSPLVFVSERGSPFTLAGFARMIERAAASAGLELKAHPHMLCHACGGHLQTVMTDDGRRQFIYQKLQ